MKPFVFKLDAVLKLRDFEKQDAYELYGQAIATRRRLEDSCKSLSDRLKKVQRQMAEARETSFPAAMQQHFFGALQDYQEKLRLIVIELSKAGVFEQQKLEEFLEAKTKVDMLDKLKEKRFSSHMKEELYKEEKEIEDLVNARYQPIAI